MNNLFLRDASIMLSDKEKSYSNSLKRLEKTFLICHKNNINIQITIDKNFFLKNHKKIYLILKRSKKKIKKITIHLTTSYNNLFSEDDETKEFTKNLIYLIKELGRKIVGICIHPDHINSWKYLKKLKTKNNYLAIEVTDKKAKYGNRISHLRKILKNNHYLKVVLDTSHIKELKKNNIMTFKNFYKNFKSYIVEAQISDFGNFYNSNKIKTTHSLLFLKKDDEIRNQIKILKEKNINFVIEGLVPYFRNNDKIIRNEINYIKNI